MLTKLLLSILILLEMIFAASTVYAHEGLETIITSIESEQVNPKDGFKYAKKRLHEKFGLIFTFSKSKKSELYLTQIDKRLTELKFTVENKDMANFEDATTRYFTTVGKFVDHLKRSKVAYNKDALIHKFSEQKVVLAYLRDKFHFDQAEYRFIQDDINYLQTYQDSLP